jgi:hypothetical protein
MREPTASDELIDTLRCPRHQCVTADRGSSVESRQGDREDGVRSEERGDLAIPLPRTAKERWNKNDRRTAVRSESFHAKNSRREGFGGSDGPIRDGCVRVTRNGAERQKGGTGDRDGSSH